MNKIKILLLFLLFMVNSFLYSQQVDVWKPQKKSNILNKSASFHDVTYELDIDVLKSSLTNAPKRSLQKKKSKTLMYFPVSNGSKEVFEVFEHSVLSKELADKYPEIKSYYGKSVNNPLNTIRFSVDVMGFHGMVDYNNEVSYINPLENKSKLYHVIKNSELDVEPFTCLSVNSKVTGQIKQEKSDIRRTVNDGLLRTYRLAVATTGEYSQYHINSAGVQNGSDTQKKAAVLSAINTAMTQVVAIFERDLSVTMELISNNDEIIFLNANTDGYTNDDSGIMLDENQDILNDIIGFSNYDIGHVFARITGGYSGVGYYRSVCASNKAGGVSASSNLINKTFIDLVSHEMGHQFGADHTFNNSCSDNRNNTTAVEPGSGTTIMSYAGACSPNVALNKSSYFHAVSIAEMWQNITEGNSTCGATQAIANSAPTVDGGSDHTIPGGTPFVLEAVTTNTDGDILTYSWEQTDNQVATMPPLPTSTGGPVFRSREPSNFSTRYFPIASEILNNDLAPTWEVVPTVSRDLNFSILVRDNNVLGGQTARDDVKIAVDGDSGPFVVTSQTTPNEILSVGEITTITWDVANTNALPVNTSLVDIYLVLNNDFENLILVDQNVTNDGSHNISLPPESVSPAVRIMVKAVDNVFFAINSSNLIIQESEFALNFDKIEHTICQPNNLVFNFTYNTFSTFNEIVTFTAIDVPSGLTVSFNPTTAINDGEQVEVIITGTGSIAQGSSSFTINAASLGGTIKDYPISINTLNSTINEPVLLLPTANSGEISLDQTLSWEANDNAQEYEFQISEQVDFSTVLESYTGNLTAFSPTILESDTQYYWRVKSISTCGESAFSTPFIFTTALISCESYINNVRRTIGSLIANTTTSIINISDQGEIKNMTVNVDINHTYVDDLIINLRSPSGTVINLITEGCGDGNDINVTFDDNGSVLNCGNNPAISGTIIPEQPLSAFSGEQTAGAWTLIVIDGYENDGGAINSFGLDICVDGVFEKDTDADGVGDTIDLCPNTPSGTAVDVEGCPIFTLPSDNYLVRITGESCRDSNDGSIRITATETLSYTATLSGAGSGTQNFTTDTEFIGLSAGDYSVCITVSGESDYQQCFDIVITEPEPLSVLTTINSESETVSLTLEGGSTYNVELNGIVTQTNQNSILLELEKGANSLKVTTEKSCQGIYEDDFFINSKISVYPNPTSSEVRLYIGTNTKLVNVDVYSILGEKVLSNTISTNQSGEAILELEELSAGTYFVNIKNEKLNSTHKIIKQ